MTRCWSKDPAQRPSMEEIVRIMTHLMKVGCNIEHRDQFLVTDVQTQLMFYFYFNVVMLQQLLHTSQKQD